MPMVRMAEPGSAKATGKPEPSANAIRTTRRRRKKSSISSGLVWLY
jgi:hypothetical protein